MIVDLTISGLGSPLRNFSSHLAATQVDRGYRMEHMENGSSLHWVTFPVALGEQVGVITILKMLWSLLRKPMHFWSALTHKWLIKVLRMCPSFCWPGLAEWGRNQKEWPNNHHSLFSSSVDPEDSLEERGFSTPEIITDMLTPHSHSLSGGEGGREHPEGRNPSAEGEGLIMEPKVQLCTNPTILSIICAPAEEEDDESDWSSESEDDQPLSSKDEASDSAIEIDRASLGSAPSNTESTWSDEEDSIDSWDLDDENRTLWDAFCKNSDPYNPLSFSSLLESQVVSLATEAQEAHQGGTRTSDHCSLAIITALHDPDTREPPTEETKKQQKSPGSSCSIKKVCFSPTVVVRQMTTWSFAHRMARRGPWEEMARDRCRFQKRVMEVEATIGWCLKPEHRETIWARRKKAMPNWGKVCQTLTTSLEEREQRCGSRSADPPKP